MVGDECSKSPRKKSEWTRIVHVHSPVAPSSDESACTSRSGSPGREGNLMVGDECSKSPRKNSNWKRIFDVHSPVAPSSDESACTSRSGSPGREGNLMVGDECSKSPRKNSNWKRIVDVHSPVAPSSDTLERTSPFASPLREANHPVTSFPLTPTSAVHQVGLETPLARQDSGNLSGVEFSTPPPAITCSSTKVAQLFSS